MNEPPDDIVAQIRSEFAVLRQQAERALGQVDDAAFAATLDTDSNSLAVLVKHLAGNLRSRWTDPLTSDGEKPDRHRDGEFEVAADDSRTELMQAWSDAFAIVNTTLAGLGPADLSRDVVIRGQSQPLSRALLRSLLHVSGHVGQMVMLARHLAGPAWTTLSIPRGKSESYLHEVRTGQRPDRPAPGDPR